MRYSRFATIVESGSNLLIYNSFNGTLLKISKEKMNEAKDVLIQQKILVEDNEDETLPYKFAYYSSIFSRQDLNVTIATTTDCNLRCPYCFEEGNKHKEYMDEELQNAIVKYLQSKKDKRIHIVWFGGEPLLCFDKMLALSRELNRQNISFTASIITNGTLLSEKVIQHLHEMNLSSIQITLDGNQEEHDKKRFFPNHRGSFELIMHHIDLLLSQTNIPLVLKINMDRNNYPSCKELIASLKKKFQLCIEKKQMKIVTNYIRNITNFKGNETCLSEGEYIDICNQLENEEIKLPKLCLACPLRCPNDIIIGPDGSIYKCLEFIGDKKRSIGNIKQQSISLSKLAHYTLAYSPFEDEECLKCPILPVCGGGCPNRREQKYKGIEVTICPAIKQNLPHIIKSLTE